MDGKNAPNSIKTTNYKMKEIILKWLELKRMKHQKLFCMHELELINSWDLSYKSGAEQKGVIRLYVCKRCGELKKINVLDD